MKPEKHSQSSQRKPGSSCAALARKGGDRLHGSSDRHFRHRHDNRGFCFHVYGREEIRHRISDPRDRRRLGARRVRIIALQSRINQALILSGGVLYAINRFWLRRQPIADACPFLRNHFNDWLATLMFAALVGVMQEAIGEEGRVRLPRLLMLCAAASIAWEGVAVRINPRCTADFKDVLCYFGGGLTYALILEAATRRFERKSEDGAQPSVRAKSKKESDAFD